MSEHFELCMIEPCAQGLSRSRRWCGASATALRRHGAVGVGWLQGEGTVEYGS